MIIDVSRPSKWGNPFRIGRDGTRHEVVAKYEKYLLANWYLMNSLGELKGAELMCHCGSGRRGLNELNCHRFVLYKLADAI